MSLGKRIFIKARREVFGDVIGNNPSLFLGEGYDFAELREYQIGDDIRKIDWLASAKLQKPYVKIPREEKQLRVAIVPMLSGSVHFGSVRFKQELIAEIAAIIAFSAARNSDLFFSYLFADKLYETLPPTKKIYGVRHLIERILAFDPLGKKADYKNLVQTLMDRLKRKSLVFILADFFAPVDLAPLTKKHEVIAVIVRDPLEENPQALGFASLVDPETGTMMDGVFDRCLIQEYIRWLQKSDHLLYAHLIKNQIRFVKITTRDDSYSKLAGVFGRRR